MENLVAEGGMERMDNELAWDLSGFKGLKNL